MKKVLTLIMASIWCSTIFIPQQAMSQGNNSRGKIHRQAGAIQNRYIVVLNKDIDNSRVAAVANELTRFHGGTLLYTYEHAIKGFSIELNEAAALALSRNPNISYVEEDVEVTAAATQSNPEWGLDRIDQRDLPLNDSYSYANSGAGVNVYVIDSGIRTSHQEFGGRASVAFDFLTDGMNGQDCYGHGTHVAGIIGGGSYGVAKGVNLRGVRVLDCLGRGPVSRVIAGVDWVTANHVKPAVANLSFISIAASDALDSSVRSLTAAGVTCVVSAGNNNIDAGTRSPSRVAEAITVAASDPADARAVFSNFGAVVDLFAPGVDVVSAWATDDASTNIKSGTSSAAAFVTGVAARYLSGNPGDSPAAVSQAITSNASVGKVMDAGIGSPNLLLYRPNGKIMFETKRDGNYELYSMNADGSGQTNLTNVSPTWDQNASYSPDGKKVVFASDRDDFYLQIYVMNSDGTGVTRITNTLGTADNYEPAWSPDGSKIAFTSNPGANEDIYVMNADGSNPTRLTNSPGWDMEATWSPDGTKIAFMSSRDNPYDLEIYVMNSDGSNQQNLTNNFPLQAQGAHNDYYPAWSPDGTKIAFIYDGEGNDEVYVMNADGSGRTNLSHSPGSWEYEPAWSPDGSKIVFETNRDGNYELYVMNADGSGLVRLTYNLGDGVTPTTANDYGPVWQPL